MAGNCNPPYACGTGGWCECNCKCIRPCGNYSCCVESITYNYKLYLNYGAKACCPTTGIIDLYCLLETDGCCFVPTENPPGSMQELRVTGTGTLKITPGAHQQTSGCFCEPIDPICDSPSSQGNTLLYAFIFNITQNKTCYLSEADALAGKNLECAVNDCDSIQIAFQPSAAWPGTCCCAGGLSGYSLGNDIGNNCNNNGLSMRRRRETSFGLKHQILSRIKKVHYKP